MSGRVSLEVTQFLQAGNPTAAASLLEHIAADPDATRHLAFIRALQDIVSGNRDRSLADAPDLRYHEAAEILFLIESLEKSQN
jgi:hypothetical protein